MSASLPIEAGQYSREGKKQQQQQIAPVVSLRHRKLQGSPHQEPSAECHPSEDYASSPTRCSSYEVEEGQHQRHPLCLWWPAFEIWRNAREYAVLHQLGDFSGAIGVDASISNVVVHHFHDEIADNDAHNGGDHPEDEKPHQALIALFAGQPREHRKRHCHESSQRQNPRPFLKVQSVKADSSGAHNQKDPQEPPSNCPEFLARSYPRHRLTAPRVALVDPMSPMSPIVRYLGIDHLTPSDTIRSSV
jgi:hypothetical protein